MNRNLFKAFSLLAVPTVLYLSQPASALADPAPAEGSQTGMHAGKFGGPHGMHGMMNPEQRQEMLIQRLGLSPEQAQKVRAQMNQDRAQCEPMKQQLHNKRKAFMEYIQSPEAKEAQARPMLNEVNNLQRQMSEQRLKSWFALRSNLTPEQLQKLKDHPRPPRAMGEGPGGMRSGRPNMMGAAPDGPSPEGPPPPDSDDE